MFQILGTNLRKSVHGSLSNCTNYSFYSTLYLVDILRNKKPRIIYRLPVLIPVGTWAPGEGKLELFKCKRSRWEESEDHYGLIK